MSADKGKKMTLEDWNKFFQRIRPVIEKYKTTLEEKRKRGDYFNIFSVLDIEKLEVKTHSAFIAELLNPNGCHGLGDRFLFAFIQIVVLKHFEGFKNDINNTYSVEKETYEGKISDDGEKGGRIDLKIQSKNSLIIIENKIDARDEFKQLTRYKKVAEKKENHCLLYLTLEGKEASLFSTSSANKESLQVGLDYYPISYKDDIKNWLERCLEIAIQHPRVRESIAQYIDLIKKLTNTEDMCKNIKSFLLSEENLIYTTEIFNICNFNDIYDSFLKNVIDEKWKKDKSSQGNYFLFKPSNWPDIFWFGIGCNSFGIYNKSICNSNELKESLDSLVGINDNHNGAWVFGYEEKVLRKLMNGEIQEKITEFLEKLKDDDFITKLKGIVLTNSVQKEIAKILDIEKSENITLVDCFIKKETK